MKSIAKEMGATVLREEGKNLMFKPITKDIWEEFESKVNDKLNNILIECGFRSLYIKCDAETNPPEVITSNAIEGLLFYRDTEADQLAYDSFRIGS